MSDRHEDEDDLHQLAELFRRHAPAEPGEDAWGRTLGAIDKAALPPKSPRRPWWLAGLVGLVAAAAVLLAVGYAMWPAPQPPVIVPPDVGVKLPAGDDDDEPFAVARASEVHVISVDVEDADRLAMGQRLLGTFEVAAPQEIKLEEPEPSHEENDGLNPWLRQGEAVPLIMGPAKP